MNPCQRFMPVTRGCIQGEEQEREMFQTNSESLWWEYLKSAVFWTPAHD